MIFGAVRMVLTGHRFIDKGPWETRSLMSVSVHDNKMYLIGGHSTTTWHLYQDIWESVDGKNWKKVGSISDDLLGVEESRQGIYAHQVLKLEDTYYLIGGNISTVFVGFVRVLKSKDMIHWEIVNTDTPWNKFSYLGLANIRPFVYKGNLICNIESGLIKVSDTGNVLLDYLPSRHPIFYSTNGSDWTELAEMIKLPNGNLKSHIYKPRVLVVNDQVNFFGSFNSDESGKGFEMHRIQLAKMGS